MSESYPGPGEDQETTHNLAQSAETGETDTASRTDQGDESLLLPIIEELDQHRSPVIGYD